MYESDPGKSMEMCRELLEIHNLDMALHVGDVYALMVEHLAEMGHHKQVCNGLECIVIPCE